MNSGFCVKTDIPALYMYLYNKILKIQLFQNADFFLTYQALQQYSRDRWRSLWRYRPALVGYVPPPRSAR